MIRQSSLLRVQNIRSVYIQFLFIKLTLQIVRSSLIVLRAMSACFLQEVLPADEPSHWSFHFGSRFASREHTFPHATQEG